MDGEASEPGWSLTFAFPNQAPDFAYGFSCGRLWEQMRTASAICGTFPTECRVTIEAMAMSLGWVETITVLDDDWIQVDLCRPDGDSRETPPVVPQLLPGKSP